jgi:hypothetical protein
VILEGVLGTEGGRSRSAATPLMTDLGCSVVDAEKHNIGAFPALAIDPSIDNDATGVVFPSSITVVKCTQAVVGPS